MNIIVGGGISGLTCIKYLYKLDYKNILLIEKENNLGGCCSSYKYNNNIISDVAISSFLYTLSKSYRKMIKNKMIEIEYRKINIIDFILIILEIIILIIYSKFNKINEYNIKSKLIYFYNLGGYNNKKYINFNIYKFNNIHKLDNIILSLFNKLYMIDDYNKVVIDYYKKYIEKIKKINNIEIEKIDIDKKLLYDKNDNYYKYNNLIITTRIKELINILIKSDNLIFNKLIKLLSNEIIYSECISYVYLIKNKEKEIDIYLSDKYTEIYGHIYKKNLCVIYTAKEFKDEELLNYLNNKNIIGIKKLKETIIKDYFPSFKNNNNLDIIINEIDNIYKKTNILIPLGILINGEGVSPLM